MNLPRSPGDSKGKRRQRRREKALPLPQPLPQRRADIVGRAEEQPPRFGHPQARQGEAQEDQVGGLESYNFV